MSNVFEQELRKLFGDGEIITILSLWAVPVWAALTRAGRCGPNL